MGTESALNLSAELHGNPLLVHISQLETTRAKPLEYPLGIILGCNLLHPPHVVRAIALQHRLALIGVVHIQPRKDAVLYVGSERAKRFDPCPDLFVCKRILLRCLHHDDSNEHEPIHGLVFNTHDVSNIGGRRFLAVVAWQWLDQTLRDKIAFGDESKELLHQVVVEL